MTERTAIYLNLCLFLVVYCAHTKNTVIFAICVFPCNFKFLNVHLSDWKQTFQFIELWRLYFIFLSRAITLAFIGVLNIILTVTMQRVCWLPDGPRMSFAHATIFFPVPASSPSCFLLLQLKQWSQGNGEGNQNSLVGWRKWERQEFGTGELS